MGVMNIRQTQVLKTDQLDEEFSNPEALLIKLKDNAQVRPFDIGCIAYKKRESNIKPHCKVGVFKVEEASLLPGRRNLINRICELVDSSNWSDTTSLFYLQHFKAIVDFIDINDYSDAFENIESAKLAYESFTADLKQKVLSGRSKLGLKGATEAQLKFRTLLDLIYGAETAISIYASISRLKYKRVDHDLVQEQLVKEHVRICYDLAYSLKALVINGKAFPHKISVNSEEVFLFPCKRYFVCTEFQQNQNLVYDYSEGRLRTPEEYLSKSEKINQLSGAKEAVNSAKANLAYVNANERHEIRIQFATFAMAAFAKLFVLMTGAYISEISKIKVTDVKQAFRDVLNNNYRSIKTRAKNMPILYTLGRAGMKIMQDYLELRTWLLNGKDCEFFFFTANRKGKYTGEYGSVNSTYFKRLDKRLKGTFISDDTPNIPAREVRKFKSSIFHELKVCVNTTAESLNHSPETNVKYYVESSPEKQQQEMDTFFDAARAAVTLIKIKNVEPSDKSLPSGHCEDFEHPQSQDINPIIEPNCTTQYGCLYCKHYCVHADEDDLRKLFSLQFVIEQVLNFSTNFERADDLLGDLHLRVQFIIQRIEELNTEVAELVSLVRHDVLELGNLTEFWEFRMQRYEALGVVI